jgi:hypothetical protein
MKKTLFALFLIHITYFAAFTQVMNFTDFKAMKTNKGIMLMNKKGSPDFSVLIAGGSLPEQEAADGGLRIKTAADKGEIFVYLTEAKLYAKNGGEPETILRKYRAGIALPIVSAADGKLVVNTELNAVLPIFDLRRGKDEKAQIHASSWNFPLSVATGARRVYLSFVIGDSILTLRKDMPNGEDTEEQNEAFIAAMKTLTILPPQKLVTQPKKRTVKPRGKRN